MPYDKGDFTQQGYDGKVSGGLLLNNKRDVDVLVSTNEDDSTLSGVAVTIEDHLNDLKYTFFGENLEAGEVYEIGAGGGIPNPTLTVTAINNSLTTEYISNGFCSYNEDNIIYFISDDDTDIPGGETRVFNILAIPYDFEGELSWIFPLTLSSVEASNEVNCTFANGEVTITDPTQDASLTLTFTG